MPLLHVVVALVAFPPPFSVAPASIYPQGTGCVVTTHVGTGVSSALDGPAATATLSFPNALVVMPDGSMLIADRANNKIRGVTPDGSTVYTVAGSGVAGDAEGFNVSAQLNAPYAIVGPDANGTMYVASSGGNRIRAMYLSNGSYVSVWAGGAGSVTTNVWHFPNFCVAQPGGACSSFVSGAPCCFSQVRGLALDAAGARLFARSETAQVGLKPSFVSQ